MVTTFGCCVGDWGKFGSNVAPIAAGRPTIALGGQDSIAAAYNHILRAARRTSTDALVLLHDDLQITDPDVVLKIEDATRCFHIAGVIGTHDPVPPFAWWNSGLIGQQHTDSGSVGPGFNRMAAGAVDGSILILSPWFLSNPSLWFDESYPGFHGYDVDICRQVRSWTGPTGVGVVDLATHHHSTLGWKSPEVEASWDTARRLFDRKWAS